MFSWLRKLWPFPWPRKSEDLPEPTQPILLIPGICGTQLAVRQKDEESSESEGNRVWVCIAHAVRYKCWHTCTVTEGNHSWTWRYAYVV
jgi:hypothetical protein